MAEFILFTHSGAGGVQATDWAPYLAGLRATGALQGGSAVGGGRCVSKAGEAPPISSHIVGYVKVQAADFAAAEALLAGHPVYEAGGVVEIRELPRT